MNTAGLQVILAAGLLVAAGAGLVGATVSPLALAAASPALAGMGLPTMAALILAALALLVRTDQPRAKTTAILLGASVFAVGALTLGALLWSGSELSLWRSLIGVLPGSENLLLWPGRVTLPAAIGLVCAGAAMVVMRLWRASGSALPIQILIAGVALTGAFGILTCLTGIGSLYRLNPQLAMMRWPAGIGLLALALALAFAATPLEAVRSYYARREDRQVFALSAMVILSALLGAWAVGAGMMIRDSVASSELALLASARSEARLLASNIAHQTAEAHELARASGLQAALAHSEETARLTLAREAAARMAQYSTHAGIIGIAVQDARTSTVLEYGTLASQHSPALVLAHPEGATLISDQGLLLRSRFVLPAMEHPAVLLTIDARLHDRPAVEGIPVLGRALARLGLCRLEGAPCAAPEDVAPMTTLIQRLARSGQGVPADEPRVVVHPDSAEGNELLAFAPIGSSGVLLILRVRVSDLLLPLRGQIAWSLSVLVLLGLIGSILIQRRAQIAVRRLVRTRAELTAVLDHVPDAIFVADHTGKVLAANQAAAGFFGATSDELCGRPIDTLLPGPARNGPTDSARSLLAQRTDGSQFPAELTVTRFALEGSSRVLFIVRDVSVQLATQTENARWVQVFEHAGWGVALTSADGAVIERANPAFASMHGCTAAELDGTALAKIIAPSFRERIPALIEAVHAKGSSSFASLHQRADGSGFPVLVNSTAVRGIDGQVLYRAISVQDISEIKAAEEALRQSEALLSAVLDALPVGVWVTDAQGRIIRGNSAGQTIWGGARYVGIERCGEFHGWWPDSGQRIASGEWALARAITKGETSLGEVVNIEAFDGSFKTISNSAVPLRDQDGLITGAIVVNEDISTRVSAAEELRLSKELFQTMVASASVGMALCSPDGQPLLVNQALCQLLGYREQELLDSSLLEITYHDDFPASLDRLRQVMNEDLATHQFEKRYVHRDGHVVWVLQAVALVRDASGKPRYFIAQLIDISLRKTMEDQLRASEHRLAQAQNMARLGDWEWDLATGAMRWSDTALDILDQPGNGLSLCEVAQLPMVNADDGARLLAGINDTLATGMPLAVDFSVAARDRGPRAVHLRGELLRGNHDPFERIRGTLQDVTERKAIEQALRESREELRALSGHLEIAREEERKRIALEVHDELGQLLTALRMQVTLLRLGSANRKDATRRLEEMRHLVDRTLGVTRHLVANLRPSALNFGLMPALEWLVEDFRAHSGLACEANFGTDDLSLDDATTTTLFRLAQEALTNVAKHAGATRVELLVTVDGGILTLKIADHGRGFQLDQALRGSHFGLAGMRERVRLLGGELRIDTAPAQGTIVLITCPLSQPCPSAS